MLVDNIVSGAMDKLNARLEGEGATRACRTLQSALRSGGVYVCYECAVPVLWPTLCAPRGGTLTRKCR
eukprot:7382420-Prymnesium_polylepis.1